MSANEFGPLFEAVLARDAALGQVEEHADEAWKDAALEAIRATAAAFPLFIVDDVWPRIPSGFETHEGRAMGAMMLRAKREGWIEPTEVFRPSHTPSHHATPRRIWRSRIHQEGVA